LPVAGARREQHTSSRAWKARTTAESSSCAAAGSSNRHGGPPAQAVSSAPRAPGEICRRDFGAGRGTQARPISGNRRAIPRRATSSTVGSRAETWRSTGSQRAAAAWRRNRSLHRRGLAERDGPAARRASSGRRCLCHLRRIWRGQKRASAQANAEAVARGFACALPPSRSRQGTRAVEQRAQLELDGRRGAASVRGRAAGRADASKRSGREQQDLADARQAAGRAAAAAASRASAESKRRSPGEERRRQRSERSSAMRRSPPPPPGGSRSGWERQSKASVGRSARRRIVPRGAPGPRERFGASAASLIGLERKARARP